MSANESAASLSVESPQRTQWFDLAAIVVCTLAWGTTWFAITKQLGVVDPVVSITYRFALAAALLFAWGALRRESLALNRAQHLAAFGVGFFTFTPLTRTPLRLPMSSKVAASPSMMIRAC